MEPDKTLRYFGSAPTNHDAGTISIIKRRDGDDNLPLAFLHTLLRGQAFDAVDLDVAYIMEDDEGVEESHTATFTRYSIRGNVDYHRLIQSMTGGYGAVEVQYEGMA